MKTKVLYKIIQSIKNPNLVLRKIWISSSKLIDSDKIYLKVLYYLSIGKTIDFNNPKTFTQKIQWLKLYNNSPICTKMVDKYEVREIIKEKIGEEYLIPLYGVWEDFNEINFETLPNEFVLKTTHDSGSIVICKDKSKLDFNAARKILNSSLKKNYFWKTREYPYRDVKPRIIAEKLMSNEDGSDLSDYKFLCFNGKPEVLFFASQRFNNRNEPAKFDFYDMELNHLPFRSKGHKNSEQILKNINSFSKMKYLSEKLSNGFPHLRVDLYLINGRIYFGELTFHHDSGIVPFIPKEWDERLGNMIRLDKG